MVSVLELVAAVLAVLIVLLSRMREERDERRVPSAFWNKQKHCVKRWTFFVARDGKPWIDLKAWQNAYKYEPGVRVAKRPPPVVVDADQPRFHIAPVRSL